MAKWLKDRSRDDLVISSKVAGYSSDIDWLRAGGEGTTATKGQIIEAVDSTLERLGCGHIDLLQVEWPDRYLPHESQYGFDEMEVGWVDWVGWW